MKIQAPVPFMLTAAIVVLVGGLTTVELPCPISGGKGYLEGAPNLKIESVESELVNKKQSITLDCADITIKDKYTYEVNVLLTNEGTELSTGTIVVLFYPIWGQQRLIWEEGTVLEKLDMEVQIIEADGPDPHDPIVEYPVVVPIYVSVPVGTTENIKSILSFERESESLEEANVVGYRVEISELYGRIPCPVSGPSGKLPLIKWLQTILR